jgi:hypothetical protein
VTTPDARPQTDDEDLTSTERKLLTAASAGRFLTLRAGSIELNEELHDPAVGPLWTDDQTIRAEVLVELLTGKLQPGGRTCRAVMLRGACITGSLDLRDTAIVCPLWLWDCHIVEPVNLNEATAPSIRLPGCRVLLLAAGGLRTTGDLMLDEKFTAEEEILLRGARIGRSLSLSQSHIAGLCADRLTVEGSMSFQDASVRGEIRLLGARIGGQLVFDGARLVNPGGIALAANRLNVADDIFCTRGFTAQGEVILSGAHVGGQINLDGASLANPEGLALRADRLAVDDNLFCECGFTAEGEVSLLGARIGGQLVLNSATLTNTGGRALTAEGLTVGEGMFCGNGFRADGEVRLHDARINGVLDFNGASLTNPGGIALQMDHAQAATMALLPAHRPEGRVILTNAQAGSLVDNPDTWPTMLSLRGFVYDRLENADAICVGQRLDWLRRNEDGYAPQIYDQLATAYRYSGDRSASRKVEIAKQRRCRSALNPLNWLWFLTVGYGYRTWWAGIWLAALVTIGTIIFGRAYPAHMIAVRTHPPAFHAVGYALDTLLPIVDLGEKSAWQPQGTALYWSWGMTLAGWTLTTAVVAGLTGVLKRD